MRNHSLVLRELRQRVLTQFLSIAYFLLTLSLLAISNLAAEDGARPLTIGLLSDLTGVNATAGEDCKRGYELARHDYAPLDHAGTHALRFVYGDHRGDARTGVSEFRKLVDVEHAIAVASPRSQIGMAINPLSKQLGVPFLGCVGHAAFTSANPYAFRFFPSTTREGQALADKALELGKKRAAVLTAQDEWNVSLSEAFITRFESLGGKVVFHDQMQPTDTDFRSLIAKYRGQHIEVVFSNLFTPQLGASYRQIRDLGEKGLLLSNMYSSLPEVIRAAGDAAAEGILFVESKTDYPAFHRGLHALYRDDRANAITLACYAGIAFALQTLRMQSDITDARSLYKALLSAQSFELFGSSIDMQDREALLPLQWKTISGGKVGALE